MFTLKMGQRGTWGNQGGPTMPPHHVVARPQDRPRQGMVWGPPGPPLAPPPTTSLSLPTKHTTPAQTRVLAGCARDFRSLCSAHLFC